MTRKSVVTREAGTVDGEVERENDNEIVDERQERERRKSCNRRVRVSEETRQNISSKTTPSDENLSRLHETPACDSGRTDSLCLTSLCFYRKPSVTLRKRVAVVVMVTPVPSLGRVGFISWSCRLVWFAPHPVTSCPPTLTHTSKCFLWQEKKKLSNTMNKHGSVPFKCHDNLCQ